MFLDLIARLGLGGHDLKLFKFDSGDIYRVNFLISLFFGLLESFSNLVGAKTN